MVSYVIGFLGVMALTALIFFIAGFCVGHAYGSSHAFDYLEQLDKRTEEWKNVNQETD